MGFFDFFCKFEGSIFEGGVKNRVFGGLDRFSGFSRKIEGFWSKTTNGVLRAANAGIECTKAVFLKKWVLITSEEHHKTSPVDPKEGPRRFEGVESKGT